jgi:predicted unusual protein kinase regulating ubiquinone biosynthesis (AarF/ABC1/UbiB family)
VLLAQLAIAIDPAWFAGTAGEEIVAELEAARQSAREPLSAKQVERILREAWGGRPSDELGEFDSDPVAVTPTAQVHRGVLDGAPVAVKVLRPGLASSVRQDLVLLDSLLAPLGAAFPALNGRAIVREARERVLDELDLEQEAGAQRRFHRALRGHPWLVVPAPIMRLAHADVLVSEWIEGVTLAEAPDRDQAAARLVRFGVGAATAGLMHADLTADDVLVAPDGRLAILDFGAWCEVDRDRLAGARDAVDAFLADDVEGFSAALDQLGWLPADHGPAAFTLVRDVLGELAQPGPARLDSDAVRALGRRLLRRSDTLAEVMLAGALAPPDLWPARSVGLLFATIARVGATGDWRELVARAVRDGWDAADE